MNRTYKSLVFGLLGLIALALTSVSALAYYPSNPWTYSGGSQSSIGTMWQETSTLSYEYGYEYGRHYYDYVAPARSGGFYGDTTAFITGLRAPIYAPVPPVYYTNYYQPVCSWPSCYLGGAGYPRAHASQFPLTTSPGGVFSY